MIICLTTTGRELSAAMDSSFGRTAYFVFLREDGSLIEAVENHPSAHGAGVQAAQIVAEHKANVLITAHVGPNACSGLNAAGVEIYTGASGPAREALEAYRAGKLERTTAPTHGAHGGGRQ